MKRAFFRKVKIYGVFVVSFIILLGALAFYLSCQSKSPTDAAVPSTESLAARGTKGTTQTTTSSSTTTTIKPLSSASISSTIITSRNLTTTSTTSTSTSTTSIPGATTSVIHPPNVKFCYIIGYYVPILNGVGTHSAKGVKIPKKITIYNGDTVYVPFGYCLSLNFYVHNVGGSPAENVKIIPQTRIFASQKIYQGTSIAIELPEIAVLPNDGVCVKHPLSSFYQCRRISLNTVTSQNSVACIEYKFKLEWKDARWNHEFSFNMCHGYPGNSVTN